MTDQMDYFKKRAALGLIGRREFMGRMSAVGVTAIAAQGMLASAVHAAGPQKGGTIKVGITRHVTDGVSSRWLDQGATQGLPIFKVTNRYVSGLVEVALANLVADKTHWQAMLKGNNADVNLNEKASELIPLVASALADIKASQGDDAIEQLQAPIQTIHYPITTFPTKVKSYNLDKIPEINDLLIGIKGQYLIFQNGVINIRKYTAYEVNVEV